MITHMHVMTSDTSSLQKVMSENHKDDNEQQQDEELNKWKIFVNRLPTVTISQTGGECIHTMK